ncbi:hypothetical protein [Aquimarina sp. SS2-1]|uniref:hypothetical protein n=1 Tax=Aquimarina besae TaxID=3342247 RepID=UPI00366CD864
MRYLLMTMGTVLFFTSCISINTVPQMENYRIETEDWHGVEYFLFKSNLSPVQTELSLRNQLGVSEDKKISNFDTKLFDEHEIIFNIKVDISTDRNKYVDFTKTITNGDDPKIENGKLETFVKIEVFDPNGENCLSRKSLFSSKTKSFLLNIKNNIREQDYINISSDR